MVNKKNGTGYQCRKSTVICWQAILSRVTGHDCSTHHPNTVVTGCTSCRFAACDLHLDNEAMRVAVGLRVGCMFCESHTCRYGATVDTLGTHAFSCKCSSSRILRHNYINDVIWRALTRAGVPSMKKPHGLVRDDGKRPEGLTLLPWNSGRSATWDVTVVDTLGNAYLQQSAITSASAAETAAVRKRNKYSSLSGTHDFFSVALETLKPTSVST